MSQLKHLGQLFSFEMLWNLEVSYDPSICVLQMIEPKGTASALSQGPSGLKEFQLI